MSRRKTQVPVELRPHKFRIQKNDVCREIVTLTDEEAKQIAAVLDVKNRVLHGIEPPDNALYGENILRHFGEELGLIVSAYDVDQTQYRVYGLLPTATRSIEQILDIAPKDAAILTWHPPYSGIRYILVFEQHGIGRLYRVRKQTTDLEDFFRHNFDPQEIAERHPDGIVSPELEAAFFAESNASLKMPFITDPNLIGDDQVRYLLGDEARLREILRLALVSDPDAPLYDGPSFGTGYVSIYAANHESKARLAVGSDYGAVNKTPTPHINAVLGWAFTNYVIPYGWRARDHYRNRKQKFCDERKISIRAEDLGYTCAPNARERFIAQGQLRELMIAHGAAPDDILSRAA